MKGYVSFEEENIGRARRISWVELDRIRWEAGSEGEKPALPGQPHGRPGGGGLGGIPGRGRAEVLRKTTITNFLERT